MVALLWHGYLSVHVIYVRAALNRDLMDEAQLRRKDSLLPSLEVSISMSGDWFLALDGDDIGRRLELCMLTNDVDSLKGFASEFDSAIRSIIGASCKLDGVELILFGGDSVMLKVPRDSIGAVLSIVRGSSGEITFSGGYDESMRGAYLALKLAKSSGKNRVEGPLAGSRI